MMRDIVSNETNPVNYIESNVRLSINFILYHQNFILLDTYAFFISNCSAIETYSMDDINQVGDLMYHSVFIG